MKNHPHPSATRAINLPTLLVKLGISRTTVWRYLKSDPSFPKPIKLNGATRRWIEGEVDRWIATKAGERPSS